IGAYSLLWKRTRMEQPQVAELQKAPSMNEDKKSSATSRPVVPLPQTRKGPSGENVGHKRDSTRPEENRIDLETTRGPNAQQPGMKLAAVKRIYVEPLGSDEASKQIGALLLTKLSSTKQVRVVGSRDDADAVLKVKVMQEKGRRI